ncbi:MAG TPA: ribonuclease HII [Candidatus Paceibacterota bacterium]|jgi:ribonuclease HII|nr:ribonuclease HII [Candidatus Paceibacterota bacterium]
MRSGVNPTKAKRVQWVAGIDEVGRGALAGPVVVAVAMMPAGTSFRGCGLGKLKDSKKLTAARREAWAHHIGAHPSITIALARVYPRQIERRNVSNAANLAAQRAFTRLTRNAQPARIFLDGGLFLGCGDQPKNAKTIIKGDEKINAIKIASIAAKVHRDAFMRRLAKKHPAYGFDIHKGYGTKAHRMALRASGPCEAHRLTFIQKLTPRAKSAIMDG